MSRFTIHMDKKDTTKIMTTSVINGSDVLEITVGKKEVLPDGTEYFIRKDEIVMFMTVSQLIDLYHNISVELDKYGVHS